MFAINHARCSTVSTGSVHTSQRTEFLLWRSIMVRNRKRTEDVLDTVISELFQRETECVKIFVKKKKFLQAEMAQVYFILNTQVVFLLEGKSVGILHSLQI
jgi:hypothetical protein